jgi:hypothetical protein
VQFEDFLPLMARKLGVEGLMQGVPAADGPKNRQDHLSEPEEECHQTRTWSAMGFWIRWSSAFC